MFWLMADTFALVTLQSKNLDVLVNKLVTENKSYFKDLIAAAYSEREFEYVLEILYHMNSPKSLPEFPSVVKKLKPFWKEAHLMHGAVKLLLKILKKSSAEERGILIESGALSTLSVLFGLLLSNNPAALDVRCTIAFPRNSKEGTFAGQCIISLLVKAVHFIVQGSEEHQHVLKTVRSLIPIISYTLKQILKSGVEMVETFALEGIFSDSINLLTIIHIHSKTHDKDLKLMLTSKIMELQVVLFNDYDLDPLNCTSSNCSSKKNCSIITVIQTFLELLRGANVSNLAEKDIISLLRLIQTFLKSEELFEAGALELRYADLCFMTIGRIAKVNPKSSELIPYFSSPENEIISTMIAFAERNPSYLSKTSQNILKFLDASQAVELLEQVLSFPSMCINRLVASKTIDKSARMQGMECESFNLSSTIFKTLKSIIRNGTLNQLEQMEVKFKVIDSLLNAYKLSKKPKMLATIVEVLSIIVDEYQLNFLTPERLVKIMPVIWKKLKISVIVEEHCIEITLKVALLLPKSHNIDFSEFEPYMVSQMNVLFRVSPVNAGLLKLIWEMAKCPQHKKLFKEVIKQASEKTVGYASPGSTQLAKIFKFISDIIIEHLERDPPYEAVHLIDLTQCMIGIARSSSLDEELYVLEDMVSPAMWLLEKQDDEKIVANVKEFINILH